MNRQNLNLKKGEPYPLGATPDEKGVNFSIFSQNATNVKLLLFDEHHDEEPFKIIDFNCHKNRTYHFWHVYVEGLEPGVHYAYRIDGPEQSGHKFDSEKVLIDPYAKGNTNALWDREKACKEGDNLKSSMRSVVIDPDQYDWEGDQKPKTPLQDTIIYEMHVKGFTKSPTSKVEHPGTFKGVIEKIPYLKELGVTAVELLPVFDFDETEVFRTNEAGEELTNYWGYSTVSYFAPEASYCVNPHTGNHLKEFRDMVKALHEAGIEVILDVVYNHTNEGNHKGPVFCFKGIDNQIYYITNPEAPEYYMDYTGCGNTVNCNHPVVEKFIIDSLKFWVEEMHVDGFRFDEGSILTRDEEGNPMKYPPVLWNIDLEEEFKDTKLITEAWDAAGLYQVGSFPGYRWAEWNGKFRDTVRSFVKGDPGIVDELAKRISGSADLYQNSRHSPLNTINFVTCHDGFTMKDLVSYNYKHNYANGENNQDGIDDNLSWNCGVEGETEDQEIIKFRKKQMKNFITILMLSQGIPMVLSGDEVGRTQQGNNNAYCQDNEISWFNWDLVDENKDLFRFFKQIINFRKKNSILRRREFFTGQVNNRGFKDIAWHGCKLNCPGWDDPNSKVLAFTMGAFTEDDSDIHVMLNMEYEQELSFELPQLNKKRSWYRFVDTSLQPPHDILNQGEEELITTDVYNVKPYSSVILISK